MKMHLLAAMFVVTLSGVAIAGEASRPPAAGRQRFYARIAGTCTNKDDFSFTGTPEGLYPGGALRIHCVVAGGSTHGAYTAQILSEEQITGAPCTTSSATGFDAKVTALVAVLSFDATQEQLFLRLNDDTASECLTPPGTPAPGRGKLEVIGGTGRFAGATGSMLNVLNPIALAFSALGGDGFLSAFSGTLDGYVDLK